VTSVWVLNSADYYMRFKHLLLSHQQPNVAKVFLFASPRVSVGAWL